MSILVANLFLSGYLTQHGKGNLGNYNWRLAEIPLGSNYFLTYDELEEAIKNHPLYNQFKGGDFSCLDLLKI